MKELKTIRLDNKIIVLKHYKNKTIKGVAKAAPEDTIDYDTGVKLAEARCNLKFAKEKNRTAIEAYRKAAEALKKADRDYIKARNFFMDTMDNIENAKVKLEEIEKNLTI